MVLPAAVFFKSLFNTKNDKFLIFFHRFKFMFDNKIQYLNHHGTLKLYCHSGFPTVLYSGGVPPCLKLRASADITRNYNIFDIRLIFRIFFHATKAIY